MVGGLSKEQALLVCCSRLELTPAQRERLDTLVNEGELSWDLILREAEWHRVSGPLYRHLKSYRGSGLVPERVSQFLRAAYRQTLARNLFDLRPETREILETLRNIDVPAILLKGPALVEHVFQDLGLRPAADLDILVPYDDAEEAFRAVEAVGYSAQKSPAERRQMRENHHHLAQLFATDRRGIVEIHTHVVGRESPLRFDISAFWDRALESTVAKTETRVLCPEDLLTHLAIHFFKDRHATSRLALGQLVDISEAIRHYSDRLDWNRLCDTVSEAGVSGPVFCALYAASTLLDAPVPQSAIRKLMPGNFRPEDMDRFVGSRVFARRYLAKGLIPPGQKYTRSGAILAWLRRSWPEPKSMATRRDARGTPVRRTRRSYVAHRLRASGSTLRRLISAPLAVREDLAADRWLHSLHAPVRRSPSSPTASLPSAERRATPVGRQR